MEDEVKMEEIDVKVPAARLIKTPVLSVERAEEIRKMLAIWENRKIDRND